MSQCELHLCEGQYKYSCENISGVRASVGLRRTPSRAGPEDTSCSTFQAYF